MQLFLSFDDGHPLDMTVLDMVRRRGLAKNTTFYIPNHAGLTTKQIQELATVANVGGHTVSHPHDMKKLSEDEQREEIEENKEWLENIIGKPVSSFCYPRGRYDDTTKRLVMAAGYHNARTTKVLHARLPQDAFETHTTVHIYQRTEYAGYPWLDVAKKMFDTAKEEGYYHLWGHSWEIEKHHCWDDFETLLDHIKQNL